MTYTVCEDQPKRRRYDVEIRTFSTRQAAERFIAATYSEAERDGESDECIPLIRYDGAREYVG